MISKPADQVFKEVLHNCSGFNHIQMSDRNLVLTFTEAEATVLLSSLTAMAMQSSEDEVKVLAGKAGLKVYNGMREQFSKNRKAS